MSRLPDVLLLDNRSGRCNRFLNSNSCDFKKYVDFDLEAVPSLSNKIELYVDDTGLYKSDYNHHRWTNFLIHPDHLLYYSFSPLVGPLVLVREGGHIMKDLEKIMSESIRHEVHLRYEDSPDDPKLIQEEMKSEIARLERDWNKELTSAVIM